MWKVLYMAIDGGKASLYTLDPILSNILNRPILFNSSFFDDLVVLMLSDSNHTISPVCRFRFSFPC